MSRLRVVGVDPGSLICGYGFVDEVSGGYVHVDCGALIPKKGRGLADRLNDIYQGLTEVIARFKPDVAAVETVFAAVNVRSAIVLGQARGVAMLALAHAGVPVHEYSPAEIKKAVVGYGRADKNQIAMMIQSLLNLPEPAMPDASDALAAAVCHLASHRFLEQTQGGRH